MLFPVSEKLNVGKVNEIVDGLKATYGSEWMCYEKTA
jgi:hypothetical protein